MVIDFAALLTRTDDEREADRAASAASLDARLTDEDMARRTGLARGLLVMTLVEEPRFNVLPNGDQIFRLYGTRADGASITANFQVPHGLTRNDCYAMFDAFEVGDPIELAGSWRTRSWNAAGRGRVSAQQFEVGFVGTDALNAVARAA
ncbi:hypothetical protein [Sphingosinicella sp. BN140058]|uniref:hypothetical protein n=1 Tax=Sphingosinicella sp. BN140058 TaxID=1892855 RepID=UPI0010133DE6|nr:hypothetical protein [Sphingosinicella sp. BN140058]QAY80243.1 hypothetical protein ETR14_26735 [Sphingosinicella sp. BN140058]